MRIILAVTGCIGAYKAALIIRLLQKNGHEVFPVMTRNAERFISALTLEKLSGNRVVTSLWDTGAGGIDHIGTARGADLLLVAPATANILGKFASGIADDFLSTLFLAFEGPAVIAPAMNVAMWNNAATRNNLEILESRGIVFIRPGDGYQACGEFGPGRLAEPEEIVEEVEQFFRASKSLLGKKVLVTAGPTIEDLDPVRFLSNRSSGKMGYALASEAARRGAEVYLVSGPVSIQPPREASLIKVRSAAEMAEAVFLIFPEIDIVIKAAAVADYTATSISPEKIKKGSGNLNLELARTVDILGELGKRKTSQFLVGFAAESGDLEAGARKKLKEKSLDMIVANDITAEETGFDADDNQAVVFGREGLISEIPRASKAAVAHQIWNYIEHSTAHPGIPNKD